MAETQQKLVVIGLGNPGKRYSHTRHNFGFLVAEELATALGLTLKDDKRFQSMVAKGRLDETEIHIVLPLTYMNLSGEAVRQYMDFYKLTAAEVVVVCDDTALEFGQLRLRPQGSAGGHNGLRSITAHLGTENYARLRMGIGCKVDLQSLADYVLSDFSAEETASLDQHVKSGAAVLRALTTEPITKVMSRVNTKLTL